MFVIRFSSLFNVLKVFDRVNHYNFSGKMTKTFVESV
jgi:hypothetical protein